MATRTSSDRSNKTGLLVILDGFGTRPDKESNAVILAKAPTLRGLEEKAPQSQLQASENHVGLPKGFMGNSEVGHLNLGAGRVVYQDFSLISRAIDERTFFSNPTFLSLFAEMRRRGNGRLHLMGLLSDGGVHSHQSHLYALLELARAQGISDVAIHVFSDGRDTSPTSGANFVRSFEKVAASIGVGRIETISGRFYAMDRDKRWERVEAAYRALAEGKAAETFRDAVTAIEASYTKGVTDEFIVPMVRQGYSGVKPADGVLFFNFRADRAREITRALVEEDFQGFARGPKPDIAGFVAMTPYEASMNLAAAYEKPTVQETIGEVISNTGAKQLRVAETEKYAHVTYFFNGGDERVFPGEKRVLIPSPREVATYDLKPEMSAVAVTESLLAELSTKDYRFAVVNYANCDMVGHTGILPAAIRAVETVDGCLARVIDWVRSSGSFALITADHGNCEEMTDPEGKPFTAHTLYPVPLYYVGEEKIRLEDGALCDVAPTMLDLMGIPKPAAMAGRSLVKR